MTPAILALMDLGGAALGLLCIPFALAAFAFWIWMLVDSAKRKQFGSLVAIALTHFLGAIAYYLLGRSSRPIVKANTGQAVR